MTAKLHSNYVQSYLIWKINSSRQRYVSLYLEDEEGEPSLKTMHF